METLMKILVWTTLAACAAGPESAPSGPDKTPTLLEQCVEHCEQTNLCPNSPYAPVPDCQAGCTDAEAFMLESSCSPEWYMEVQCLYGHSDPCNETANNLACGSDGVQACVDLYCGANPDACQE